MGLGLKASWGGTAFSDKSGPDHLGSVTGLAAGTDGRVYVMDDRSGWLYRPAKAVHVFRRDGACEKTIKPFPSNMPLERLKATGAFRNGRGFLNPVIHRTLGMTFHPFEDEPARQMAVTPDGRLLLAVLPSQAPAGSNPAYRGERDEGGLRMAVGAGGKCVYMVNLGNKYYDKMYKFRRHPVVYRAPLPAMGPAEVFFGEKDAPGADEKHLADPTARTASSSSQAGRTPGRPPG